MAQWIVEKTKGCVTPHTQAIGYFTDKIIAGTSFEGWNGNNCYVHQRIDESPPKSYWYAIANYGFNGLNCKRLTGTVPASNERAIQLNKHLGFKEEAILKDAAEDGDLIIMVLWKQDCKILNWRKYGR